MVRWVVIALIIWFIIVNPSAAATAVHSIGHFVTSVFTA